MGRRNFRNKTERRRYQVRYTPSDVASDWEVFMTNGSDVHWITVTGTRVSAWNRAIRIGLDENDNDMPGRWWPLSIDLERSVTLV
jgi:hypothetical protein